MIHDGGNPEDKHPPDGDGNTNHTHVKGLFNSDTDGPNIMSRKPKNFRAEAVCYKYK